MLRATVNITRSQYFVPICLICGIILRVIWIFAVPTVPDVIDSKWYYERGIEIAAGKGFVFFGKPTAFWPVGYPGFLGILFHVFGDYLILAKLANIFLYAGSMICAYWIA